MPRHRLVPLETMDACDAGDVPGAKPSGRRTSCPDCDKTYAQGAVVNAEGGPRFSEQVGGLTIKRTGFCDHCGQLFEWVEAWMNGRPTGVVVTQPVLVTDRRKVEAFLREHPKSAGVLQV